MARASPRLASQRWSVSIALTMRTWAAEHSALLPPPDYRHPRKNWRLKRGATPQWYKHRHGVRTKAQPGAARVARFRPPRIHR